MSFHDAKRVDSPEVQRDPWSDLRKLSVYIWDYRGRVALALACLVLSKLATVGIPLVLRDIIDTLDAHKAGFMFAALMLVAGYGALRLAASFFNELRDVLFARVRYGAMHALSVKVLGHLHELSLRYHLERRTGNISRDLERGTRSLSSILNYMVFNILPTAAEFLLVSVILLHQYNWKYTAVIVVTVLAYVTFTLMVTNWRMHFRHEMNALDSEANGRAVDSLLNYETVKYFNNEELEIKAYDKTLSKWADAGVQSHTSMSMLNFGQGAIVAVGVTAVMFMASTQVGKGELTLGDLVLINSMMLQLFMPLNILGIVYRQLQYSMADMGHVVELLERQPEVKDRPGATALQVRDARVVFDKVSFSYQAERLILEDVSITVEPGQKLAVVGPSGAGKSTLMRLLFRFYDVDSGCICIDDQDIREVTPRSLRKNLGVVPQDTVLFNNTIAYNIAYAKPDATEEEIRAAARQADLEDFIAQLPDGYETVVGERGLKLSGGEKQRLAIARVFLKNPPITILDEATSSLDTHSEKAILGALEKVSSRKTSLVIAHRLSTIVDADQIVVLDQGRVIEQGTHDSLLQENGMYASLWYMQLQDAEEDGPGEG